MTQYTLHHGESSEILKQYPDNHFDSIITDPPYGIDFLGKGWDAHTGEVNLYKECLRVLKPGGYILAFSSPRTYHKLATSIEEAGFEIRDQIMWIYTKSLPKSQDIGRQIQKRIGVEEYKHNPNHRTKNGNSLYQGGHQKSEIKGDIVCTSPDAKQWEGWGSSLKTCHEPIVMSRKPFKGTLVDNIQEYKTGGLNINESKVNGKYPSNIIGELPEYQDWFFCPKVEMSEKKLHNNNHPCVKPIALMEYLIKLVTPSGGLVLDPFNGSGSTGCAAVKNGYRYVGCELDEKYIDISQKRIQYIIDEGNPKPTNNFDDIFE